LKFPAAGEQDPRHARRRIQQLLEGERPLRIDDRDASAMLMGLGDERKTTRAAAHPQTLRRFFGIVYQ
jgi:hypothetical protein